MNSPFLKPRLEIQPDALTRLDAFIQKTLRRFPKPIGEFDLKARQPRLKPFEWNLQTIVADLIAEGRDPSMDAAFNNFQAYFNLFFDEKSVSYVDEVGKNELLRMAIECALCPEVMAEIQFRVGIGASDKPDISARTPAYILPLVRLLKQMPESFAPQMVVYSAVNRVIHLNNLDPVQAKVNNNRIFDIFQGFLADQVQAEARQGISLKREDAYDPSSSGESELLALAEQVLATQTESPIVQRILHTAQRNNSDPREGLAYGVSHAIYSLDPMEPSRASFFPDEEKLPSRLVMVGGAAEVDYWRIRQLVSRPTPSVRRAQIIQANCEISPYGGALLNEDITIEQIRGMARPEDLQARLKQLRSVFRKDIEAICALSGGDELSFLETLLIK